MYQPVERSSYRYCLFNHEKKYSSPHRRTYSFCAVLRRTYWSLFIYESNSHPLKSKLVRSNTRFRSIAVIFIICFLRVCVVYNAVLIRSIFCLNIDIFSWSWSIWNSLKHNDTVINYCTRYMKYQGYQPDIENNLSNMLVFNIALALTSQYSTPYIPSKCITNLLIFPKGLWQTRQCFTRWYYYWKIQSNMVEVYSSCKQSHV